MTEKRYKEIMAQIGMPDSQSLLLALQQVANKTAQKHKKISDNRVLEIIDACFHAFASNYKTEAKEMAQRILHN